MRVALYLQSDLDEGKHGSNFDADLSAGHEGDTVRWNTEPADGSPAARYELCFRKDEIRLIRADDARMEICFRENEWSEACLSTAHGEIRLSVFTENLILTPAPGATSNAEVLASGEEISLTLRYRIRQTGEEMLQNHIQIRISGK